MMNKLSLISIGLSDAKDISLKALQEAKDSDTLYAELYTTKINTDAAELSQLAGKPIKKLKRQDLEEEAERIIAEAKAKRVAILVGGDALTATTHLSLILEARKQAIPTQVIHGSSILTAVAETGLSPYHFGKLVTIPLPQEGEIRHPTTPYTVLTENLERSLHTLLLLDLDAEKGHHLTANDAIKILLEIETEEGKGVFKENTLAIVAARLGSDSPTIKGGLVKNLLNQDFGSPSQVLIVPGQLHFVEEEALKLLANISDEDLKQRAIYSEDLEVKTKKYITGAEKVFEQLKLSPRSTAIDEAVLKETLGYAKMYLSDADHYLREGRKASALASVCYCEGILDALRLMKLVNFEW